jgi:hypothetical protein
MIEVVQAFDRAPITRLDSDDRAALDRKIEAARRLFSDRCAEFARNDDKRLLARKRSLQMGDLRVRPFAGQ